MSNIIRTLLYKDYQIELSTEFHKNGNWTPVWWIWISDEAIQFNSDQNFTSMDEALSAAEENAKEYVDRQFS